MDDVITCETHPHRLWSGAHQPPIGPLCPDGCEGPGMPLAASLDLLRDVGLRLKWIAEDSTSGDAQAIAEGYVDRNPWVEDIET